MTVPDLDFSVEAAEPLRFATSPHINFQLRVANASRQAIHTVLLKCQIHLDVSHRHYNSSEQRHLADLFGEPRRWGETLRAMLWTNTTVLVPSFDDTTVVDVPVPCTFDFNIPATKYFGGIEAGDIPVSFYFSGTVFYAGDNGLLQVGQISWEKEAFHRMPITVWREMMEAYYPNTAWLCLQRDIFDRLYAYKVQHGIPTFDQTLMRIMEKVEEVVR
jgi:Family of unknown function (DUF6084)